MKTREEKYEIFRKVYKMYFSRERFNYDDSRIKEAIEIGIELQFIVSGLDFNSNNIEEN